MYIFPNFYFVRSITVFMIIKLIHGHAFLKNVQKAMKTTSVDTLLTLPFFHLVTYFYINNYALLLNVCYFLLIFFVSFSIQHF